MFKKNLLSSAVLAACLAFSSAQTTAGVIFAPINAVINDSGPGFGSIDDTFNQSGLSGFYINGVTDFDVYLASDPTHTYIFSGFEWFSNSGSTSATVTYNLGQSVTIDRLALWNDESSGIGTLKLQYSLDNLNFSALSPLDLKPTDNATDSSYKADVFSFAATTTQYVRFIMSDCPQPNNNAGTFPSCAIGEVAFRKATTNVPEPASLALLGIGLTGLGFMRRRRT